MLISVDALITKKKNRSQEIKRIESAIIVCRDKRIVPFLVAGVLARIHPRSCSPSFSILLITLNRMSSAPVAFSQHKRELKLEAIILLKL